MKISEVLSSAANLMEERGMAAGLREVNRSLCWLGAVAEVTHGDPWNGDGGAYAQFMFGELSDEKLNEDLYYNQGGFVANWSNDHVRAGNEQIVIDATRRAAYAAMCEGL